MITVAHRASRPEPAPVRGPELDPFAIAAGNECESVHLGRDADAGLEAIVAIHDTALGPALGGCRYQPYPTFEAALRDAVRLAEAMSRKAALAGVPFGGGKAVVWRRAEPPDRARLFEAFGRFVDSLGGRYITAEDAGTGVADMDAIARTTRWVVGTSASGGDPSPVTAFGVRHGIEAALGVVDGDPSLDGVRVAVQGLGHVGAALARELAERGARLIVADVDPERARACARETGARVVEPEAILGVECDVLAPCALGGVLDDASVPRIRARIVAGSANNQLAEPRHGVMLWRRGATYVPDYVVNAGGLIDVATHFAGGDRAESLGRAARIGETVREILERARAEGRPPSEVADAMARERLDAARRTQA